MYSIYRLIDPRDGATFYVGMTEDVYVRFLDHIQCSGRNFAKNTRIIELRAANKMVIMETLEEVEKHKQAYDRETYWINHFEMLHQPLMNITQRSSFSHIAAVTLEKRNTIQRLHAMGKSHRYIATAVGLAGRKYAPIYRPLCQELGIAIREAL